MKDAGIEAKRDSSGFTNSSLTASLGAYEGAVTVALKEAEQAEVIQRIRDKDASLWKDDEAHRKMIFLKIKP